MQRGRGVSSTSLTIAFIANISVTMTDISLLPLAQQIDQILQASGKARIQLLMQSQHIAIIVPLLPPGELWLTVGEVGKNDAMLIMENATGEQWQTLFDLATWIKDELDPKEAVEWLHTMVDVDAAKASRWFRELDRDFSVLLALSLVTVVKRDSKDADPIETCEWPNALPPWTLDGQYYLQGKSEDSDTLVRTLFKHIADDDLGFLQHLCETVTDALPIEQTESAFEARERRLAEEGFPPYEESVAIYQPLTAARIRTMPRRDPQLLNDSEKQVVPRYPLVVCDQSHLFIAAVMARITDGRFLRNFSVELAGLANKVMIADQRPMEPGELRESTAKVVAMINLGLEAVSGSDAKKARTALQSYWARDLFKVGVALMRKLP